MAGAFVRYWDAFASAASLNKSPPSAASVGNLLVSIISHRSHFEMGAVTLPRWTQLQDAQFGSSGYSGAVHYKVAEGNSNDDWNGSWTDSNNVNLMIAEYSGLHATAPFEGNSNEDETLVQDFAHTAQFSGSATPGVANGLAIAFLGVWTGSSWDSNLTVTNSFVVDANNILSSSTPKNAIASKVYTGTGAQSTTFNTTDTGASPTYGVIALFKEPAAGGGPADSFVMLI